MRRPGRHRPPERPAPDEKLAEALDREGFAVEEREQVAEVNEAVAQGEAP
ncbi:hypothetical protein ACGFRB_08735 [Streptomyces sp. NPDC048718]